MSDEKVRQKHKHYDCIVAWAEGKEIQTFVDDAWHTIITPPLWYENKEYRIKPEPKPDVVGYMGVKLVDNAFYYSKVWDSPKYLSLWSNKLKFVFDGETGKLKSAEVLNMETTND